MSDIAIRSSGASSATTSSSEQSLTGLADDFSTFLTLLTTQLQNQDPLDPTDTNEFTNQLVAFTQVEQQIRSNQELEDINEQLAASNLAAKAGFLGQLAQVQHDTGSHEGNGIRFQYSLDESPEITNLRVVDASGNIVFEQGGETRQGTFNFNWDGLDNLGNPVPHGNYKLIVDSDGAEGEAIPATVFVEDEIREIDATSGDFLIADRTFGQNQLLRLIANGI